MVILELTNHTNGRISLGAYKHPWEAGYGLSIKHLYSRTKGLATQEKPHVSTDVVLCKDLWNW